MGESEVAPEDDRSFEATGGAEQLAALRSSAAMKRWRAQRDCHAAAAARARQLEALTPELSSSAMLLLERMARPSHGRAAMSRCGSAAR